MKEMIEGFIPQGGMHCITNSLKQIFYYYNKPMTENMIFGIGLGLSFTYINLKHSPMISGRSKPFEFEKNIANALGINIKCKQSKDKDKVFNIAKSMIDNGHPVLVYVDMPYMKFLNLNKYSHFGGHSVILFGYDDENECFYVSDRDNSDYPIRTPKGTIQSDFHIVPYSEVEEARNSNFMPYPANNKYLEFDFTGYKGITESLIKNVILCTCESMINPPAKLLGINGIKKFSNEILNWKKFDNRKLMIAGSTNYFQINADGGTGGGCFRKMFGEFLIESSEVLNNLSIRQVGNAYLDVSNEWDIIGNQMWQLKITGDSSLLTDMSERIANISNDERNLLSELQSMFK